MLSVFFSINDAWFWSKQTTVILVIINSFVISSLSIYFNYLALLYALTIFSYFSRFFKVVIILIACTTKSSKILRESMDREKTEKAMWGKSQKGRKKIGQ